MDRLAGVPPGAAAVDSGAALRFEGPGGPPDEITLSVYTHADFAQGRFTPVQQSELNPEDLHWRADLQPGDYVLALFRAWKGRGDAVDYFGLRVQPRP